MKKLTAFWFFCLFTFAFCLASYAGQWTANGYFYKPSMGASGQMEYNLFNQGLDQADAELFALDPPPGLIATPPLTYNAATGLISLPQASARVSGYLASGDWSAFNAKEPAISLGTSLQYWRGDKTWQTLNPAAVGAAPATAGTSILKGNGSGGTTAAVSNTDYAAVRDNGDPTYLWNGNKLLSRISDVWASITGGNLIVWGSNIYGTNLATVISTIGSSTRANLIVPPGTFAVSANVTVTPNIRLLPHNGANISIPTGVTLTINGGLEAGLSQIFSCTGTGKVAIGDNSQIDHVCPEWWGALGNAWYLDGNGINAKSSAYWWYADAALTIPAHDDAPALQAAVNCVMSTACRRMPRIDLNGHYLLNEQLVISGNSMTPYFHGSGGGQQNSNDSDYPPDYGNYGTSIINGTSGYGIQIAAYTCPFFDNIAFYGGVTDAPGTGSIEIVDWWGGQGWRNCTFIKGHAGVCIKPTGTGNYPWGLKFDTCRFINYLEYAPTYNSDWITSPSQDRASAIRFENAASMTFTACSFGGWPSFFYGTYNGTTDTTGFFNTLVFLDCYLQSSAMQSFYTAGQAEQLLFYHGYFEGNVSMQPYPQSPRAIASITGTDNRLAAIDVNSSEAGMSTIMCDQFGAALNHPEDSAGNQGRTFLVAASCDVDIRGGNFNTGQRPFARLWTPRHMSIVGAQIGTGMSGSFPLSSGDALDVFNTATPNFYSPVQGDLIGGNYCAGLDATFTQQPSWMTRAYTGSANMTISRGPLVGDSTLVMGHYQQNVWAWNTWGSPTDLGTDSFRGDIIWETRPDNGTASGLICIASGSGHGGSGNGTWVHFGQVGYRSGSGSPSGSVTPNFIGEDYFDTTGHWWKSTGLTNTSWVEIG